MSEIVEATPLVAKKEDADVRVHVSHASMGVYIFRLGDAVNAIKAGYGRRVGAGQAGVSGKTSKGTALPWHRINNLIFCPFVTKNTNVNLTGIDEIETYTVDYVGTFSHSEKGALAEEIVSSMIESGTIALPMKVKKEEDKGRNIMGTDLIAEPCKVQVKCDLKAGKDGAGGRGTGNLYIEDAECNPLGRH